MHPLPLYSPRYYTLCEELVHMLLVFYRQLLLYLCCLVVWSVE